MESFENENLAIGPLFMVTGVMTFLVVAIIFVLTGMHDADEAALIDMHEAKRPTASLENDARQTERLENYSKTDDVYQIPIERAMELVVDEAASK
jgi:hypothetical protein